ncbi:hypothetical protein Zmor_007379 [Zophobas morio]|uniref:Uncharacterized protein n=1 Tax=Zophobas morio TaxID=2755281 RepID=A0AA38IVH6_9CUCU|nr:hypothetical protein Zmor_007379 [Zophobas morio]
MEVPWAPASFDIHDEMSKHSGVAANSQSMSSRGFWVTAGPTDVGIHRIRSPTQNWLQFSITGITRSATKQKKAARRAKSEKMFELSQPQGFHMSHALGMPGKS